MTTIPGTTKAQTIFLRAFRTSPTGPAPEAWPSPSILRRWLRRPAFRAALNSLRAALRFQADFQLSASATHAIKNLSANPLTSVDVNRLLRISHLRQRLPENDGSDIQNKPEAPEPEEEVEEQFKCPLCRRRAPDPLWTGDKAIFKQAAFRAGYTSPLQDWPHFPNPVPQDTFYYQLVQDPGALLWYMYQYDRTFNDHRYQPILHNCKPIIPVYPEKTWPAFTDSPPIPDSTLAE